MTTEDIIILIFCSVDDQMQDIRKHGNAKLYASELVLDQRDYQRKVVS